jgi:hypothetical protein
VRLPLPSPKAAIVPEQLRRYYGDILMITEFIHLYGKFLSQDTELKCSPGTLFIIQSLGHLTALKKPRKTRINNICDFNKMNYNYNSRIYMLL